VKRNTYIIVIILAPLLTSYSQNIDSAGFDKEFVKELVFRQFSNILTPKSKNNIGNFAALDLNAAEVNFNGNIKIKNSILGIKVIGGVSDGFLSIFKNTSINTEFGLDIQYNLIDTNYISIQYDDNTFLKYKDQLNKINKDYESREIDIEYSKKILELEIKNDSAKLNMLLNELKKLNGLAKDSLTIIIQKDSLDLKDKKKQLYESPSINVLNYELNNERKNQIKKIKDAVRLAGFKIGWWSIAYGIKNHNFKLFDPTESFNKQIASSSYASQSFRIQYSYYNYTPAAFDSYYYSFGMGLSLDDNLTNLSKLQINETKNYGPTSSDRSVENIYTAYQGKYLNNLKTLSIFSEAYWFLFTGNRVAYHIYPEYRMTDGIKPIINFGIGLLYAFKSQDNMENIINVEVYANLLDLVNNRNSTKNIIVRSDYGLRFIFPINFNLN
jgi:hypothetical protein